MCKVDRALWLVDKDTQDDPHNDIGKLSAQSYKDVITKIQSLPGIHRPSKKREALREIHDLTNRTILNYYSRAKKVPQVTTEDLIPILEFLIIRSGVANIGAEIDFIRKTMPNSCVNGIAGFMTATFFSCLKLIEESDYKELIVSKLAMAEAEAEAEKREGGGGGGGNPEALRKALYESYNAPNSFLNTIMLDVIKKYPVCKPSTDSAKFPGEFVKARNALEAKTRDSLKSEKLNFKDGTTATTTTLLRACRDAIINFYYNGAMEVFEKDEGLKAMNIRVNSGIQLMKESVTFEMIDPEHRRIDFDMSRLVPTAAAFGDRRRSISERMRSLYELGVLAGKDGKSGAIGLALIRAGVQNLCTQVFLFNAIAVAGVEEESKAVRILVEAERAVKHVSETWSCTEEIRRAGWRGSAVHAAIRSLIGNEANRYGRIVAKARRKALEVPEGKNVADNMVGITDSMMRDVLCGCPESAVAESREAIYNTLEVAVVEPNYATVLGLFAGEAEEADTLTYQKIRGLKGALSPKNLGLNAAYCGCGEEDMLGDRMAYRYVAAVKGLENITSVDVKTTGGGELQMLKDVLNAIAKSAAVVSENPVSRVEEGSILRILLFLIVHREIKGLHGHVLFMEAFLEGNRKCEHHLSVLKKALELIDTLFLK